MIGSVSTYGKSPLSITGRKPQISGTVKLMIQRKKAKIISKPAERVFMGIEQLAACGKKDGTENSCE